MATTHQPGLATTYAPLYAQYAGGENVAGAGYSNLTPSDGNTSGKNMVNVLLGYNPKKYSGKLLRKFYQECVLSHISNTDYEGEIKDYGDSVIIRTIPDIQVKTWKKGDALTYDTYETGVVELKIDRGLAWAFTTDPLDQKQTDIKNFVETWTTDAAKRQAIKIEEQVFKYVFNTDGSSGAGTPEDAVVAAANKGATAGAVSAAYNLGTTASPVSVNPSNVIAKINDCGSVMAEQNLPVNGEGDFWMVIDQKMANLLMQSDLKLAYAMGDGKSLELRGGQMKIPHLDIFDIYRSNILPTAVPSGGSYKYVLFGHKTALTFAAQLTKNEVLPNPNAFGLLHRGLIVYGFKVIYPKNIGCMICTYSDSPAATPISGTVSVSGDVAMVNSATEGKTVIQTHANT